MCVYLLSYKKYNEKGSISVIGKFWSQCDRLESARNETELMVRLIFISYFRVCLFLCSVRLLLDIRIYYYD